MPKKTKPKKRKPKVVTRSAPDTGPIRSLRRDPFAVPTSPPPVTKRIKIKAVATDQSGNQHVPEKHKRKTPLVPKKGRQKRRGATRSRKK